MFWRPLLIGFLVGWLLEFFLERERSWCSSTSGERITLATALEISLESLRQRLLVLGFGWVVLYECLLKKWMDRKELYDALRALGIGNCLLAFCSLMKLVATDIQQSITDERELGVVEELFDPTVIFEIVQGGSGLWLYFAGKNRSYTALKLWFIPFALSLASLDSLILGIPSVWLIWDLGRLEGSGGESGSKTGS